MKTKISKALFALGVILCMSMTIACDNFMDLHKEYIRDGEHVYAPIVDSVTVYSGNERIVMKIRYYNGHNLQQSTIYWNNKTDSLVVDLKPHKMSVGYDSIEVNIPDLPESAYSFYIVNYDHFGNKSLEVEAFGNSYGDDFRNSLINRSIRQLNNFRDRFEIHWAAAADRLVNVEVKYIDENGNEVIERRGIQAIGTYTKARDDEFMYRSIYIPEAHAVDLFATEWSEPVKLPEAQ